MNIINQESSILKEQCRLAAYFNKHFAKQNTSAMQSQVLKLVEVISQLCRDKIEEGDIVSRYSNLGTKYLYKCK